MEINGGGSDMDGVINIVLSYEIVDHVAIYNPFFSSHDCVIEHLCYDRIVCHVAIYIQYLKFIQNDRYVESHS